MTKNSLHCTPYLRNHRSFDCHLLYTCVKRYLQGLFPFFKNFIFRVISGVKGQNMVQNDKKFCLLCSTSQNHASYDCHLWYMCEMIISPGIFFKISKVWFSWLPGSERAKTSQKWETILWVLPYISGTLYHIIFIYGTHL